MLRNYALALGIAAGGLVAIFLVASYAITRMETEDRFTHGSEPYRGARWCAGCHPEHYRQWTTSLHSRATTVRFRPMHVFVRTPACYSCHGFRGKGEGVACEICHGPGHTAKVDFGTKPLCIRCHAEQNPITGAKVMLTYDEWLDSQARAAGMDCYDCHMPPVEARGKKMHFHGFPGNVRHPEIYPGKVRIAALRIEGASAVVGVENTVTGHFMPTGCPTKYIELELAGYDRAGKATYSARRVFQRRMSSMMARVLGDNRLRDGERRELRFALPAGLESLTATLLLHPSAMWRGGRGKVITLDRQTLALSADQEPQPGEPFPQGGRRSQRSTLRSSR